ncbi:uncharacterized protein CANTADRAFT_26926 [Suhomyces tanzawaensis NRRL Y-17324]|uniref:U1-type domain-containing protein n=1 Tax=Suhomyces tanzawaensis NRRL Y-17324 TaxID=984487 RepID=A0A1E4SEL0_9ASCO|nr:uncharacterized protein CANTADRAFT_26926 [Suhomyces tanzawaensis NRRL Y-17324]ODV77945.1 hypothetical protein CANTADRAFT_26926 [Suhomyces tanzawaensis NRRL Y-17324]
MDYSGRVNAKKGGGGVAGTEETNVHTRRRIKELLATQVLDLENDPYVFKNQLGLLECKLCLTTHVSEASYISHLGGRKHQMNLEKRKVLDEKLNHKQSKNISGLSITNTPKRSWVKIGKPSYKVTKVRDPETLRVGLLVNVKYPQIGELEPRFRIMSYYELTSKNQNVATSFIHREASKADVEKCQYLVISGEPYENLCFVIPGDREISKPDDMFEMSDTYWWYWDKDTKEYFLQFMYGVK